MINGRLSLDKQSYLYGYFSTGDKQFRRAKNEKSRCLSDLHRFLSDEDGFIGFDCNGAIIEFIGRFSEDSNTARIKEKDIG